MQNFFGFLFELDWLFLITFAVFAAAMGVTLMGQALLTRQSTNSGDELGRTPAHSPAGN